MIYFIQAEHYAIKIGHCILSAERRMKDMQTGCPLELTLLGTIKGHASQEKTLHDRFKKHRLRGEWFSMDVKPMVEGLLDVDSPLIAEYPQVIRLKQIDKSLATLKDENRINKLVREKESILALDWV